MSWLSGPHLSRVLSRSTLYVCSASCGTASASAHVRTPVDESQVGRCGTRPCKVALARRNHCCETPWTHLQGGASREGDCPHSQHRVVRTMRRCRHSLRGIHGALQGVWIYVWKMSIQELNAVVACSVGDGCVSRIHVDAEYE